MPKITRPGWVPKYRHHKSSGQAYVTLGGRDVYLGRHGSDASRAEYDRVIAEWLASARLTARAPAAESGRARDAAQELTVGDLILMYWRYAQPLYPPRTLTVIQAAYRPLRKLYGHTRASEFRPLCLKALQTSMAEEKDATGERPRLCRRTINDYSARIRHLFKWGVSEGLVPPGVWDGLRAVPGLRRGRSAARETDPIGPAPDSHVEAALPHLPPVVADMVRLQRLTGARPGEICSMTASELDTRGAVWLYRPRLHKTAYLGRTRQVAIGPKAQAILKTYLRPDLRGPLFSPAESDRLRRASMRARRQTPLTPSQKRRDAVHAKRRRRAFRESYTGTAYALAVRRACLKAGVPAWCPNQLRHSRATEIRKSHGLDAAGAVLGHAKLETTQIYAERSEQLAAQIALATG